METFGHTADPHPQALQASVDAHPLLSVAALGGTVAEQGGQALTAEDLARLAMAPDRRRSRSTPTAPRSTPADSCPT